MKGRMMLEVGVRRLRQSRMRYHVGRMKKMGMMVMRLEMRRGSSQGCQSQFSLFLNQRGLVWKMTLMMMLMLLLSSFVVFNLSDG